MRPVPGDVPPPVWPEIRQLTGDVAALFPGAGPLRLPVPGDLPPPVWPEIQQLTGDVAALFPGAGPLRLPVPGDVPPRVWPEIQQLTGDVAALFPGAWPLRLPVPGDLDSREADAALLLSTTLSARSLSVLDEDTRVEPEPEPGAPTLATVEPSGVVEPAAVREPAVVEVAAVVEPPPVEIAAVSVEPAVVAEPAVAEVASVVEPSPVEIPAVSVEPAAVAAPVVAEPAAVVEPTPVVIPAASEPAGREQTPALPVVASQATEQFLPLRRQGRSTSTSAPRVGQLSGQLGGAPQEQYTGDPISMEFQGSDLRAVLRVFASDEVSGLNMVIDPSVQGEVNVSLNQVPWDQAFAIILRANGLDFEVDGTVVRIASVTQLQQEAADRALLIQREEEAGELALLIKPLSYARAENLTQLITDTTLSARGQVFTDPRTNTIIIRDLQDRLTAADSLLDSLDQAEPQVEIEARIVQAGHDSAHALGVQWGITGRVAQDIGNTLPFSFPNRGGLTGRVGGADGQGPSGIDPRALPDENAATLVNLGVAAATSAVGLTLGSVNGSLNLDVVLSALESQGELSIISSPRVMTQNNVTAEILQGDQIPYQTVANNTVTVQFKEAALTLRVTPQITASDTVIMAVELENSFADFGRALGDPPIPSIVTQRAQTTVQVADGETTVIGGIFENTQTQRNNRTPMLHRIPLLGWLFKSSDRTETTDELECERNLVGN